MAINSAATLTAPVTRDVTSRLGPSVHRPERSTSVSPDHERGPHRTADQRLDPFVLLAALFSGVALSLATFCFAPALDLTAPFLAPF